MDCKAFRDILDLYVDGELFAAPLASARAHLGECPTCRRAVEDLRWLKQAVKRVVLRRGLAQLLENATFQLDGPRTLVFEGRLVCRDCELKALYGVQTMCHLKGHHGALKTADGKIWTFIDGRVSSELIEDASLRGRRVRLRGRLYRRAGCLGVESFQVF